MFTPFFCFQFSADFHTENNSYCQRGLVLLVWKKQPHTCRDYFEWFQELNCVNSQQPLNGNKTFGN